MGTGLCFPWECHVRLSGAPRGKGTSGWGQNSPLPAPHYLAGHSASPWSLRTAGGLAAAPGSEESIGPHHQSPRHWGPRTHREGAMPGADNCLQLGRVREEGSWTLLRTARSWGSGKAAQLFLLCLTSISLGEGGDRSLRPPCPSWSDPSGHDEEKPLGYEDSCALCA